MHRTLHEIDAAAPVGRVIVNAPLRLSLLMAGFG